MNGKSGVFVYSGFNVDGFVNIDQIGVYYVKIYFFIGKVVCCVFGVKISMEQEVINF